MRPPPRVVVAGHVYTIALVDDPEVGLARYSKPNEVGHANLGASRITVRGSPESSVSNQRDSVLHEVLHAVMVLYGYLGDENDVYRTPRMGERVIEVAATGLLDVFRRNPDLVTYLMEGDTDATEEGQVAEDHQREHPPGDQGRSAAEAGPGDRAPKGWQAEEVTLR